ncbi:MAG TPA: hemolysin family protein [Bacteroidia bacterium]|nr:hemolysin family protein [Bacteroidia bacterium]
MELIVIFILTFLNGFFALAEIALVSVKRNRIEHLAIHGNSRAKTILKLLENPENFLSSVQVGITLIGIISGAYGGAALTDDMERYLSSFTFLQPYVRDISLIIVIGGITYFSIVIGELVPKSIAMNNAEAIALTTVPIIKYFTIATYPFVKLLSLSTKLILKIGGLKENENERLSEEELLFLLKNAGKQGVLETEETQVHQNLFSFTDQTAKSLMTNSKEVEWINYNDSKRSIIIQLRESVHSKFIVGDGSKDKIKGIVTIKEFLENHQREDFRLDDILHEPIIFTSNTPAFKILNTFKKKKQYIGVVVDEYGGVKGIVTLHDLIEAIVGDLPDEDETNELNIIKQTEDTYLINGMTLIYELNQYFQRVIIEDNISSYSTISGFMLEHFRAIPREGDTMEHNNIQLKVMHMDGNRIDRIVIHFKN